MLHNSARRRDNSKIIVLLAGLALALTGLCGVRRARAARTPTASGPPLAATFISGSSVYSAAQLYAAYRAELGRPITPATVRAILVSLQAMYVHAGYWPPALRVDDSLVSNGILEIAVLEPRISSIAIRGDPGPYRRRLDQLSAPLRGLRSPRTVQVRRQLQHMRALPGLTVVAHLLPDKAQQDAYQLRLDVSFRPVSGMVQWTNLGTNVVGPNFFFTQLALNDVLHDADQLGVLAAGASAYGEYHGAGLFANLPLGDDGTALYLSGFRSRALPSEQPVGVAAEYEQHLATLQLDQSLSVGGPFDALSFSGALDLDDFIVTERGVTLQADRLRVFELAGLVSWHDAFAQYASALTVRHGLDGLGAGLEGALFDSARRIDFTDVQLHVVRVQQLSDRWTLRLDALGQDSWQVLPYTEQFKIGGGELIGEGFAVAEFAGDAGIGGKAQLSYRIAGTPQRLGVLSAYGAYDVGALWQHDEPGSESAASAVLGLSLARSNGSLYVEAAKPLTHPDINGKRDTLLLAGATLQF
jgi:hemolysin activation/secretion protein